MYVWRLFNKNLRLENHPRRFIIFETLAAPGKPPNNPIPSMWVDPMDAVKKIFLQTHFWQGKLFSNVGKNYKAPGKCKPNVTLVFFDVTQTLYRCYSAFKHTLKKWNKILFRSQNGFIIIPKNLWNPAGVLCSTPRELKMSLVWPVLNKLVR